MQQNISNKEPLRGSPHWGESKYWSYKDLRVHFRVTGEESNPPIVLIHGFGASSDHWRNNAEIFASEGFRVFGIDLIGFGKSEQNLQSKIKHLENQFWANQLASFLDEIVDIQKNGKVILIGNLGRDPEVRSTQSGGKIVNRDYSLSLDIETANLGGFDDLSKHPLSIDIETSNLGDFHNLDCVFLALPHGSAEEYVKELIGKVKIIDLSSDYRINDAQSYEKYYKSSFDTNLQNKFTYGFIESKLDDIKKSENIANPGCFALASQSQVYQNVRFGLIIDSFKSNLRLYRVNYEFVPFNYFE